MPAFPFSKVFYPEVLREVTAELFLLKSDSRNKLGKKKEQSKKESNFPIVKLNNCPLTAHAVLMKEQ